MSMLIVVTPQPKGAYIVSCDARQDAVVADDREATVEAVRAMIEAERQSREQQEREGKP